MKTVLNQLQEISDTSSTLKKVELLGDFLKNPLFKKVIKFTLDSDKHYNIKKFPEYKKKAILSLNQKTDSNYNDLFNYLQKLTNKNGASNTDKEELFSLITDEYTHEIIRRICLKDLRCGVNAKLVNKAIPGTINIVPYMRCSTEKRISEIVYPAIIQEKADGMFVNFMINKKGQIKIITRNGKIVQKLSFLKNLVMNGRQDRLPEAKSKLTVKWGVNSCKSSHKETILDTVYTGELLVMKGGRILPRTTGNGILNQCIQGTVSKKDAESVVIRLWDSLPLTDFKNGECKESYQSRFYRTRLFCDCVNDKQFVDVVEYSYCESEKDTKQFYLLMRKNGKEGAIVKNVHGIWKNHTSPNQVKMKNIMDVELRLIQWEYGKKGTKFEKCIGSLHFQSDDQLLKVNVGSGLSEEQRGYVKVSKDSEGVIKQGSEFIDKQAIKNAIDFFNNSIGKIFEIECESIIQDKRNKEIYSLFLPRLVGIREDRSETDTIKELLKR